MDNKETALNEILTTTQTDSVNDLFEFSDAPSNNFNPCANSKQPPHDGATNAYTSEDEKSLDAVLANVHHLIDCLNAYENKSTPRTSRQLVEVAAQHPKTPKTVDDLIFELCGDTTTENQTKKNETPSEIEKENNGSNLNEVPIHDHTADKEPAQVDSESPLKSDLTATTLTSEHQWKAVESAQVAEKSEQKYFFSSKNSGSKLNFLNQQDNSCGLESAQILQKDVLNDAKTTVSISADEVTDNQTKKTKSEAEIKASAETEMSETKLFKKSNSEMSHYFRNIYETSNNKQAASGTHSVANEQSIVRKEKKKLNAALSLPVGKRQQKDNQLYNFKSLLPRKRKQSKDKMQSDLKVANLKAKPASHNIHDVKHPKESVFLKSENSNSSLKETQAEKSSGSMNRRKNISWMDKKFLSFRRSQSLEGKKHLALSKTDNNPNLVNTQKGSFAFHSSLPDGSPTESPTLQREKLFQPSRNRKLSYSNQIPGGKCSRSLSSSPRFEHLHTTDFSLYFDNNSETVTRVDSEPKIVTAGSNEFVVKANSEPRRRATMDSTSSRPKFFDFVHRKKDSSTTDSSGSLHLSTSRQSGKKSPRNSQSTSAKFLSAFDSDESQKSSQESLDDDDLKNLASVRQLRVTGRVSNISQHQLEHLRSLASKSGKKNKLRKPSKYAGKSPSVPNQDNEESAERTWLPEIKLIASKLKDSSYCEDKIVTKDNLMTCCEADVCDSVDSTSSSRRTSSEKKFSSFMDLPWVSYEQLDFYRSASERRDFSNLCYLPISKQQTLFARDDAKTSNCFRPSTVSSNERKSIVDIKQYEKKLKKNSTSKSFGRSVSASLIEKNGEKASLSFLKSNKKMQFKRHASEGNMDVRLKNSFDWAKTRYAKINNRQFAEKFKTRFSKKTSNDEKLLALCSGGPLQMNRNYSRKRSETWGECTWVNMSGKKVELESTRLQSLSELECDALRRVSLARLQDSNLGVSIVIPKDESKILNRKVSIKKKYAMHLPSKEKHKDKTVDHVFGIPLVSVVENDQLLRLQKSASFAPSLDYQQYPESFSEQLPPCPPPGMNSSVSSGNSSCSGSLSSIHNHNTGSLSNDTNVTGTSHHVKTAISTEQINDVSDSSLKLPENNNSPKDQTNSNSLSTPATGKANKESASQPLRRRGAIAAQSINEIDPYQSQLLEALSLSVAGGTAQSQRKEKKRSLLPPSMPQVPYVVQKCCDHLAKYGLEQTGIFRIAGSKKRVKQLREEFDRGIDVTIDETYNPHDVAALLKEFFRDLPEALLTRELYSVFIQTTKLNRYHRLSCLRYLVWLLPLTNRDTLHTLLQFLAVVAAHSEDTTDRSGNKIAGNKMNVINLATIFGPNILHRHKKTTSSGDNQYQVQSLEKAEENTSVIKVMEDLIGEQKQLFQIPKENHDQMLRILKESDPEAVDFLLRRKAANHMREKSRLLGLHSPTNNSNKEFAPKEVSIVGEAKAGDLSQNNDKKEKMKTDDGRDASTSAVMGLSYQQAAGHSSPQPSSKENKNADDISISKKTFSKCNYPVVSEDQKNVQIKHPSSPSSPQICITPTISECKEIKDIEIDQPTIRRKSDVGSLAVLDDSESTSSSCSFNIDNIRSTTFTDDDMQAILGEKRESINSKSETMHSNRKEEKLNCEKTEKCSKNGDEFSSSGDKVHFKKYNLGEDETRYTHKMDDVIRAANSSDSGVYVDPAKNLSEFPKSVDGRAEFNLEMDFQFGEKEKGLVCANSSHKQLENESVFTETSFHLKERKDSLLENSSDFSLESDDHHENSANSIQKIELVSNNVTDYNKNNVRLDDGDDHPFVPRDSSPRVFSEGSANLRNPQESVKPITPATADSKRIQTVLDSSLSSVCSRVRIQSNSTEKPLSPRSQQKEKTLSFEKLIDSKKSSSSQIVPCSNCQLDQKAKRLAKSSPDVHKCTDKLPKQSPNNNRRPIRGSKVAMLANRYSRDDSSLSNDFKQAPGSRWTSAGLVGNRGPTCKPKNDPDKNNNADVEKKSNFRQTITNKSGKQNALITSRDDKLSWHPATNEPAHQLPETFV